MIVKGHEAKSPFLPGRALLHDVDALYLAVLLKVLADVVLFSVLLNAANKDLLHRQMGTGFVGVLRQEGGITGVDITAAPLWEAASLFFYTHLPLSTQRAWVQQLAHRLCEAWLSWPRRPPPLKSM